MWGAAACAFSASTLSHFSITTKVSSPNFVWKPPSPSASGVGTYSTQPCSACTARVLARNASRILSRMPGFAVMTATTWITRTLLQWGGAPDRPALRIGSAAAAVQLLLEELLHGVEELHAVLLHDDGVRALAQHDQLLRRRARPEREQRLRHVGRRVVVPFRQHQHGGDGDLRRVIERLAGRPVRQPVLHDAVRRAQHRRVL